MFSIDASSILACFEAPAARNRRVLRGDFFLGDLLLLDVREDFFLGERRRGAMLLLEKMKKKLRYKRFTRMETLPQDIIDVIVRHIECAQDRRSFLQALGRPWTMRNVQDVSRATLNERKVNSHASRAEGFRVRGAWFMNARTRASPSWRGCDLA